MIVKNGLHQAQARGRGLSQKATCRTVRHSSGLWPERHRKTTWKIQTQVPGPVKTELFHIHNSYFLQRKVPVSTVVLKESQRFAVQGGKSEGYKAKRSSLNEVKPLKTEKTAISGKWA